MTIGEICKTQPPVLVFYVGLIVGSIQITYDWSRLIGMVHGRSLCVVLGLGIESSAVEFSSWP